MGAEKVVRKVSNEEFVNVAPVAWSGEQLSGAKGQWGGPSLKVWLALKMQEMYTSQ